MRNLFFMKTDEPKKLQSETAYRNILDALSSKQLPLGSKLSLKDLERFAGTAVGPIRDALKVLEADGIVKVHPRSGIEVIKPSVELARSTFQYRTIIERAAVRQFAETASPKEIDDLRQLHLKELDRLRSVDSGSDQNGHFDHIENAFHAGIIQSLKNEQIDTSFRRLHLLVQVIKLSDFISPRAAETTLREHIEILDACEQRDGVRAEAKITDHLMNALTRNLGLR